MVASRAAKRAAAQVNVPAVPMQVPPDQVCIRAQRCHIRPVRLCVTAPSTLSEKSEVGVVMTPLALQVAEAQSDGATPTNDVTSSAERIRFMEWLQGGGLRTSVCNTQVVSSKIYPRGGKKQTAFGSKMKNKRHCPARTRRT